MATDAEDFIGGIARERADWLLDAVACATQDRRFLRGEPEYDEVAGDAILMNGEKAIRIAIARSVVGPAAAGAPANAPAPIAPEQFTPEQLAAMIDEMSNGPVKGGLHAVRAYRLCAHLIRRKLMPPA